MSTPPKHLSHQKSMFHIFVDHITEQWKMPLEFHENYEFFYALTGRGLYQIGKQTYPFQAGDLFFVRSNELHKCINLFEEDFQAIVVLFDSNLVDKLPGSPLPDASKWLLANRDPDFYNRLRTGDEGHGKVLSLLTLMRDEYTRHDRSELMLYSLFHSFLIEASRTYQAASEEDTGPVTGSSRTAGLVQKTAEYISKHYQDKITLGDIAQQVFVNPSYLSRVFKQTTGCSISDYIMLRRIKQSREYLKDSDISVADIAYMVGYSSPNHFHWAFRKITNMSPREYRKTYRGHIAKHHSGEVPVQVVEIRRQDRT